jgi:hypothetical protein
MMPSILVRFEGNFGGSDGVPHSSSSVIDDVSDQRDSVGPRGTQSLSCPRTYVGNGYLASLAATLPSVPPLVVFTAGIVSGVRYLDEFSDAEPDRDAEKRDSGNEPERACGNAWYDIDKGDGLSAGVLAFVATVVVLVTVVIVGERGTTRVGDGGMAHWDANVENTAQSRVTHPAVPFLRFVMRHRPACAACARICHAIFLSFRVILTVFQTAPKVRWGGHLGVLLTLHPQIEL